MSGSGPRAKKKYAVQYRTAWRAAASVITIISLEKRVRLCDDNPRMVLPGIQTSSASLVHFFSLISPDLACAKARSILLQLVQMAWGFRGGTGCQGPGANLYM